MSRQNKTPGDKGRWPVKATAVIKDMLSNAISNAETKGLPIDELCVTHAQCNRAPPGRRRTYRAHGRIGKYASQPAHIEFTLTKKRKQGVKKATADEEDDDAMDEGAKKVKITRRRAAKGRFQVPIGGGTN